MVCTISTQGALMIPTSISNLFPSSLPLLAATISDLGSNPPLLRTIFDPPTVHMTHSYSNTPPTVPSPHMSSPKCLHLPASRYSDNQLSMQSSGNLHNCTTREFLTPTCSSPHFGTETRFPPCRKPHQRKTEW